MATLRSGKLVILVLTTFAASANLATPAYAGSVRVIHEIKHDVSLPLRDMAKMVPVQKQENREIELRSGGVIKQLPGADPVVQTEVLPPVSTTDLLNFDGQAADGVAPPDTEGAVGGTQYVQWVNLRYNVYDKTTGALILGPVGGNAIRLGIWNRSRRLKY